MESKPLPTSMGHVSRFQTPELHDNYEPVQRTKLPTNAMLLGTEAFACPFTDELNDLNTICATSMFSYINLHGNYPPGLFASLCKDGKEGLSCNSTDVGTGKVSEKKSRGVSNGVQYPIMILSMMVLFMLV